MALLEPPSQVRADVQRRVAAELGLTVQAWSRVVGGTQNRLFRLDTLEGQRLLAKLYVVDRWPRLESEYATLRALNEQHLARVPRALLRCDELAYAVYSFEPGEVRLASQLTRRDVEVIAAFTADLHRFGPHHLGGQLAPAVDAALSTAAHRHVIQARLSVLDSLADTRGLNSIRARVDALLSGPGDDGQEALPRHCWRLTTGDFGPQNMLFGVDCGLTVVDFEAAGWDDPAHAVMGFVAHATSEDLSPGLSERFLGAYAELSHLSAADTARYERVGRWMDLEWVAVYASALSSDTIANKASAIVGFSAEEYVAEVVHKLQRRLARAVAGHGYKFPDSRAPWRDPS